MKVVGDYAWAPETHTSELHVLKGGDVLVAAFYPSNNTVCENIMNYLHGNFHLFGSKVIFEKCLPFRNNQI